MTRRSACSTRQRIWSHLRLLSLGMVFLAGPAFSQGVQTWQTIELPNHPWIFSEVTGPGFTSPRLALGPFGEPHVIYLRDTGAAGFELYYASLDMRSGTWSSTLVAGPPAEGHAVVVDSAGFPHISYNAGISWTSWGYTHHLWKDSSGWNDEVVDTIPAGYDTSIALDSLDQPHVVYDEEQQAPFAVMYRAKIGGVWGASEIISSMSQSDGRYSRLRIDSMDVPHVAYSIWAPFSDPVYAYRDPISGWQVHTITASGDTYRQVSMDLDSLDRPHVLYHDSSGVVTDLYYAFSLDSGLTWSIEQIANGGGKYASIELDASDVPHVVMGSASEVVYLVKVNGNWRESRIATGSVSSGGMGIATDVFGRPYVVFVDASGHIVLATR